MNQAVLRVLIVEDFPIVALGIRALVEDLGHTVVAAATCFDEALEAASQHRPDLVIMDVDLGGDKDGIDAAVEIRSRFGTPSLFLTGHFVPDIEARAARAEPIVVLDKAAPRSGIRAAIEGALASGVLKANRG